jgi:hypothetical protein
MRREDAQRQAAQRRGMARQDTVRERVAAAQAAEDAKMAQFRALVSGGGAPLTIAKRQP